MHVAPKVVVLIKSRQPSSFNHIALSFAVIANHSDIVWHIRYCQQCDELATYHNMELVGANRRLSYRHGHSPCHLCINNMRTFSNCYSSSNRTKMSQQKKGNTLCREETISVGEYTWNQPLGKLDAIYNPTQVDKRGKQNDETLNRRTFCNKFN